MNRLPTEKRALILRCLCEGMGVRGTARTADCTKNTVLKLLVDAGKVCEDFLDEIMQDLPCRRLQADEIWAMLYASAKKVATAKAAPPEAGDIWTWTVICADTRLVAAWKVGDRTVYPAIDLFKDLRRRVRHRPQITTDGLIAYLDAVPAAFGLDVDFATVLKPRGEKEHAVHICGKPDPEHIHTCYVERHNCTIRSSLRRFTRRSSGFSRKPENHAAAVSLFMFSYNCVQIHDSLKGQTPAMAAGLLDAPMTPRDLVALIDAVAPKPRRPKTYKKRKVAT